MTKNGRAGPQNMITLQMNSSSLIQNMGEFQNITAKENLTKENALNADSPYLLTRIVHILKISHLNLIPTLRYIWQIHS